MKKKAKISDLTPDPKNANQHSEFGQGLLTNSTRQNGIGRSILISNDNVIIAGNGLVDSAGEIGIEDVEIVESDGTKIIAVKRIDIESGTKEFYNMALADNIVAQKNIVMDAEVVEAIVAEHAETKFWGNLVLEDEKPNNTGNDRTDLVEVKLYFTSKQHAHFKEAIKTGKTKYTIRTPESDSEQSNIVARICQDFNKKKL